MPVSLFLSTCPLCWLPLPIIFFTNKKLHECSKLSLWTKKPPSQAVPLFPLARLIFRFAELTTVALRLGWRVPSLGPLLMLVEYTNYIANNKPRYLARLDVVKRVELFQQYHLLGLPVLSWLYHIQVNTRWYGWTRIIGGIPFGRPISSGLFTIY